MARKKTKKVKPHAKVRKSCKACSKLHTLSQHASHGRGSYDATHDVEPEFKGYK